VVPGREWAKLKEKKNDNKNKDNFSRKNGWILKVFQGIFQTRKPELFIWCWGPRHAKSIGERGGMC
jgi:hypothetical protein